MSRWELRGAWGAVTASSDESAYTWEAKTTLNKVLMRDLLETARAEYPNGRGWSEPGRYVPDKLEEAVRRLAAEFGGEYALLERDPPLPPGAIA